MSVTFGKLIFSKFRERHIVCWTESKAQITSTSTGRERLNESLTLLALRISENSMIQLDSLLAQLRTALAVHSPQIEFQI